MEQTIQALSGLMLKGIATVCLLILVYYYLKLMLFGPLEKVLAQREELTEGARKAADASLAEAERKQREYEHSFTAARTEVYRLQEETRRKWLDDQAGQVAEARRASEETVRAAKTQITQETAAARENLAPRSAELAGQIADVILARKAGSAA
jgi:F-type H+-transporting ATPase subunit b